MWHARKPWTNRGLGAPEHHWALLLLNKAFKVWCRNWSFNLIFSVFTLRPMASMTGRFIQSVQTAHYRSYSYYSSNGLWMTRPGRLLGMFFWKLFTGNPTTNLRWNYADVKIADETFVYRVLIAEQSKTNQTLLYIIASDNMRIVVKCDLAIWFRFPLCVTARTPKNHKCFLFPVKCQSIAAYDNISWTGC